MGKLIVVSNRVSMPGKGLAAGGLAIAMEEALHAEGGTWCGWSGNIHGTPESHMQHGGRVEYLTHDLTPEEYDQYYLGFSNSILWPLFHNRTEHISFSASAFDIYDRVNARFAQLVGKQANADDMIWVQDYHLLTFARHLRQTRQASRRIGFFLHIPFPPPEIFAILTNHQYLLKSLAEYDLIGFQTDRDRRAFIHCLTDLAHGHVIRDKNGMTELELNGRRFTAGTFPVSIDTGAMRRLAEKAAQRRSLQQVQRQFTNQAVIIGVDRLDYTKGIPERLQALDLLLKTQPTHVNRIAYVQIAPPSREKVPGYSELRERTELLAAHMNGEHGDMEWLPVRYINKSYTHHVLAGFYRMAKIGLVTPLRDGMNLVAKEYTACQNPDDPGVLVLSRFAGAAAELAEGALLTNPYDPQDMANAIHRAMTMPLEERQARHAAMMAQLDAHTIFDWSNAFLRELQGRPAFEPVVITTQGHYEQKTAR